MAAHGLRNARDEATDLDRAVAAQIRLSRAKLGLTQAQFAKLVGVAPQQIHKYETALSRISITRLVHMCKVLGLDAGRLLTDVVGASEEPETATSERKLILLGRAAAQLPPELLSTLVRLARDLARNCAK
jgi:transcriptional regulator with XRE-family HTH domain